MIDYNNVLFDQLLLHLPCAIYWRDCKGRYLGCNQLFAQQVGLPIQDIVGKTDLQLPKYMHSSCQVDQEVMRTRSVIESTETRELLDRTLTLQFIRIPLLNQGRLIGMLGVTVDITEKCDLRVQANVANQLKTAFISDMEHDIRTPLSGILGTADMLASEESNQDKKENLINISECSKALLDYCTDIINLSKIEKKSTLILMKTFDLKQLIDTVVKIEMPAAQLKKIELKSRYANDLPSVLSGDPQRIKQILLNLVSNAIKFTEQGYVYIKASCVRCYNRNIVISLSVIDSGVGIPEEKQDWIFAKFTKVKPSNMGSTHHQGVGLYIVKQFVDELDGDLHLQTVLGQGSTFTVHLPLRVPLTDSMLDYDDEGN